MMHGAVRTRKVTKNANGQKGHALVRTSIPRSRNCPRNTSISTKMLSQHPIDHGVSLSTLRIGGVSESVHETAQLSRTSEKAQGKRKIIGHVGPTAGNKPRAASPFKRTRV